MTRPAKVLLVVAGYALALFVALAVTHAHQLATSGPAWQGYSGMLAFGDSILFLGVFGVTAVPATGAALYFLRPVRLFWQIAATIALLIAATALAAFFGYLLFRGTTPGNNGSFLIALSPIRVLLAPLFGTAFLLGLVFAPSRSVRLAFLTAALIEAAVFVTIGVIWWSSS
jgi:hypothetical protein